jgi:putative transposase
MKYNPDKHHRQSVRLKDYDYASAGAYFITLFIYQKQHLFGEIVAGEMVLNEVGKIVDEEWLRSTEIRKEIELDEFVIMPNHIHGIAWILPSDPLPSNVGARGPSPLHADTHTAGTGKRSLGPFIGGFKSSCTKRINGKRGTLGIPVWQRNYYEYVIRNEEDCNRIREYIQSNPTNWSTDEENQ